MLGRPATARASRLNRGCVGPFTPTLNSYQKRSLLSAAASCARLRLGMYHFALVVGLPAHRAMAPTLRPVLLRFA